MNYPVWNIPFIGGSLAIAIIAVIHVYLAHFAVGGGLFLVLLERQAVRDNQPILMSFVRSYARFFLVLTLVFGAVTGVGIWFIIALVHPAATSVLIHNFVFAWATEWVFFLLEITAILIYYYTFDKIPVRKHLLVGWIYFISAYLSLVIISGIVAFMLTPGKWLETGNFWHGFFNPSYFPSLIFRTGISLILAGTISCLIALLYAPVEVKTSIYKTTARWVLLPLLFILVGGFLYLQVIPSEAKLNLFSLNPEGEFYVKLFLITSILLFLLALFLLLRTTARIQPLMIVFLVSVSFSWFAGFEYMREIARKPFVIYNYLYSNGVFKAESQELQEGGFLPAVRFNPEKVKFHSPYLRGETIFRNQCLACHTIGGYNDIVKRIRPFTREGLLTHLSGQGKLMGYMPPFWGTEEEKHYLVDYLLSLSSQKEVESEPVPTSPESRGLVQFEDRPGFASELLLAWATSGIYYRNEHPGNIDLLPERGSLEFIIVKRGKPPKLVTEVDSIFLIVKENQKLLLSGYGKGVELKKRGIFAIPFRFLESRGFFPEARNEVFLPVKIRINLKDGTSLSTQVMIGVNTGMGCWKCHRGEEIGDEKESYSPFASIIKLHDRHNRTDLQDKFSKSEEIICRSCHASSVSDKERKGTIPPLSVAVHGFHAIYLQKRDSDACINCHSSSSDTVRLFRGRHFVSGLSCVDCHGYMEDQALSLLKGVSSVVRIPSVERMIKNISPVIMEDLDQIQPRRAWVNQPRCFTCHPDFNLENFNAFNAWTSDEKELYRNMQDEVGLPCLACHNSPHAIYPVAGNGREGNDNLQPLVYQGEATTLGGNGHCNICHQQQGFDRIRYGHHKNIVRE